MDWQPEKLCTAAGDYDLSIERFKHGYKCENTNDSWKWRIIRSGVVVSQGTADTMERAQELAASSLPLNS